MKRIDDVYRQRLRRDKLPRFATDLTVLALAVPVVVMGMLVAPGMQARVAAPIVAALVAMTAGRMGEEVTSFWIVAAASGVAALGGFLLYRDGMLRWEGTARR